MKRERKHRVDWLRKKGNGNEATLALADKLEGGKPHTRKIGALPPPSRPR